MGSVTPLVSIVVPAYNAADTVEQTLRSAAAQTYPFVEIIVVDDGSSDDTAARVAAFCDEEPSRRLLRKQNGGVASARNAGIAAASGDFVAPLDADDLWHPAKLERQVAAMLAAAEPPGFVYCWSRLIDAAGRVSGSGDAFEVNGFALQRHYFRNFVGNGSSILFSRRLAAELGGYDESLRIAGFEGCEDIDLQLRIAAHGPVVCVPEFLVGYRVARSTLSDDRERMFKSWQVVAARAARAGPVRSEVRRWALARRSLTLAEHRALRGSWLRASYRLIIAAALDPRRSLAVMTYRAARTLVRRFRRAPVVPAVTRPFSDWSPTEPAYDPNRILRPWADRIRKLDRKRLRELERHERKA